MTPFEMVLVVGLTLLVAHFFLNIVLVWAFNDAINNPKERVMAICFAWIILVALFICSLAMRKESKPLQY